MNLETNYGEGEGEGEEYFETEIKMEEKQHEQSCHVLNKVTAHQMFISI